MARNTFFGVLLFVLTSCASMPTAEELSNSIIEADANNPFSDVQPERAACVAQKLLETDLSDTTLQGLAENFAVPKVLRTEKKNLNKTIAELSETCKNEEAA